MTKNLTKEYDWNESKTCAHNYLLPSILKILRILNIAKDSPILDAGCGSGYILGELSKKEYKDLWGFDFSNSGIALAKKEFSNIADRFEIHDVYKKELPVKFPQKDYDVVLSSEVVEHLYDPNAYLANINYWIKKGGYLIITVPYHGYLKNLAITLLNKWDKHHTTDWEGGHIRFFSKKTLSAMLIKNDFIIEKFYGVGRFWFFWKSMIIVAKKI
ncbi:MAG: class I SAM-dependent methyltransferase [Elusimicrobia bacterium]|nr:class I SAM-dependent methyltransferase [Elusimicrobiota bacterium]